jgi:SH3-like domain-containing protein
MKKMNFVLIVVIFSLLTAGYTNALCVNSPKANLRSGPGTNYDVVWEIYKYMPVVKVGVSLSGAWYAVGDLEGDVSWIHKTLVTGKYKCAVVNKDEVNVRTGPGTNYSKSPASPAKKYYSLKVLKKKGQWVKMKDDWGNTGWIHRNFLWIR